MTDVEKQDFWNQVTNNYDKMKAIINRMNRQTNEWSDNEEIFHQACLQTYEKIDRDGFTGSNYMAYINVTALNIIRGYLHKKNTRTFIDIETFDIDDLILQHDNTNERIHPTCPNEFITHTTQEEADTLRLKKADALWPAVKSWVSNPKNVNQVDAGLFKFKYLTHNTLKEISEKTGYSIAAIHTKSKKVLALVKEEFKDFDVE